MNQVADILRLAEQAEQQNVDAVLATVIRTEGSAYRRAGAMMLICADGRSVGMISGGCLEPHIIKRAFWLTRWGAMVQVYQTGNEQKYYDSASNNADELEIEADINSDDELNFGLGCNGKVHVLFERLTTAKSLLDLITQVRQDGQSVTIATLIQSEHRNLQNMPSVGSRINLEAYKTTGQISFIDSEQDFANYSTFIKAVKKLSDYKLPQRNTDYVIINSDLADQAANDNKQQSEQTEWLIQRLEPQKRLVICGAGNDVMPLVTMAKLQDWHVTVIDSRAHYATSARFAQADKVECLSLDDSERLIKLSDNAAVAVMSHSLSQDRARLSVLLEHPPIYLGQLGPRYRTERLVKEISATVDNSASLAEGIAKLHYPIGFKLGGDGPEALALSIMAQISSVMNEQQPPVTSTHKIDRLKSAIEDNATNSYIGLDIVERYAHD